MSIIQIKDDSIEFTGTLDDFKREISSKFAHRDVAASEIAKKFNVTIKTLYSWAHKYDTYRTMGKRNYTVIQKMKLILAYDSLRDDEKGDFLRRKGLYDDDILLWKSEIVELEDMPKIKPDNSLRDALKDEKARAKAIKADLHRTKTMLNKKNGELKKKDRRLKEAEAIIELKKKAEILFGNKDEE